MASKTHDEKGSAAREEREEREEKGAVSINLSFATQDEKRSFNMALKELMRIHGFATRGEAARFSALKALEIHIPR